MKRIPFRIGNPRTERNVRNDSLNAILDARIAMAEQDMNDSLVIFTLGKLSLAILQNFHPLCLLEEKEEILRLEREDKQIAGALRTVLESLRRADHADEN